jgi:putative transposase
LAPGKIKAELAENLLIKRQLLIINHVRPRVPALSPVDRIFMEWLALFLAPRRWRRAAVMIKPSTPLNFHRALIKRKYSLLFSSVQRGGKPGPKGPSAELISTIVAIKRHNPRFGCTRIAFIITDTFDVPINKDVVRRVLAKHYRPDPALGSGPSWLSFIRKRYLSSDNDRLFTCHRWRANPRILGIKEIKSIPRLRISHPFIKRLIGTIRREYLDHVLFWTATDLERKLD